MIRKPSVSGFTSEGIHAHVISFLHTLNFLNRYTVTNGGGMRSHPVCGVRLNNNPQNAIFTRLPIIPI